MEQRQQSKNFRIKKRSPDIRPYAKDLLTEKEQNLLYMLLDQRYRTGERGVEKHGESVGSPSTVTSLSVTRTHSHT
ncbi:hypothetical protein ANN_24877 [Periplaneta americana]|uniref:Uncharacterized protein n=1 Tax=Periplaneta americana TaxID=6978 RepID=A0ABQ8RZU3_PERAM|nr:hypothetical protein ANN_24877 [Periplaneta americana]